MKRFKLSKRTNRPKQKDISTTPKDATTTAYLRHSNKKRLFLAALTLSLIFLSLLTIRLGGTDLNFKQIIKYLFAPDGSWNSSVVWDLRLPRVLAAILAGAGLGIAGAVMQTILRNPLASPFTLGISNAAAFGAALAIVVFNSGSMVGTMEVFSMVSNPLVVTLSAFTCAMLATIIIIGLIHLTESTPETIVLAGLAISSIFGTGLAILTYLADDVAIASIVFWQFGSLSKAGWTSIAIISAVLIISFLFFFIKRWDYNSIEAGEDVAKGLGVKIAQTRILSLIISALLTSTVVSFFGIIGFIGLIGPHMVKRLIGNDNRFSLIGSMLTGATVLMLSHIVGSYAFSAAIPVGIITSAIGGPLFLMILMKGDKR
ncbi:MAG: iron ABC transporter permease [Spirochaetales bacterium]|nr:iron ABC transporter permease [Spirochaetales bacterium]